MSLTIKEQQEVFNLAEKNKQAFAVDWNLDAEDVAFNIKMIIPALEIDGEHAVQIDGSWIEKVIIEGSEYQFELDLETKPIEIVKKANLHLVKTGKTFVLFDSMDDQYCFILIDIKDLPDYLEKGFVEV